MNLFEVIRDLTIAVALTVIIVGALLYGYVHIWPVCSIPL